MDGLRLSEKCFGRATERLELDPLRKIRHDDRRVLLEGPCPEVTGVSRITKSEFGDALLLVSVSKPCQS